MTVEEILAKHGGEIDSQIKYFNRCNDKSPEEISNFKIMIVNRLLEMYNDPGGPDERKIYEYLHPMRPAAVEPCGGDPLDPAGAGYQAVSWSRHENGGATVIGSDLKNVALLALIGIVAWMMFSGGEEDYDYQRQFR